MKLARGRMSIVYCLLPLLFLFAATGHAQDMQKIKARMVDRKPTIDLMKAKGSIGEGNDGYLHIRQQGADTKVVNEENTDRRAVNSTIAKKEGTSVDQVSRAVAAKLRASAPPGHWVQKDDGTWQKK